MTRPAAISAVTARQFVAAAWRAVGDRLDAGGPAPWDRPTRLTGWSVADLAAHCCWGTSLEADALERARTGVREPAVGVAPDAGAGRDAVLHQLQASCNRLVAELDALIADPHGRDLPLPYGDVPLDLALAIFVMEAGVHASDVAHAVGADDTLAPEACRATPVVLASFGPVFADAAGAVLADGAVIEVTAPSGTLRFGQRADGSWTAAADRPVTTTITGTDPDVWLFALGRRPLDAVTVTGDPTLARSFKRLVPGP